MDKEIEFTVDSEDGIVDCRVERKDSDDSPNISVVVLYPHHSNGIAMSKVYEYELIYDKHTPKFTFSGEAVHPSIKHLEQQISGAIIKNGQLL